jgi:hypothetical protein
MNRIATRAKSSDSCVSVKEAVAVAEGDAVVGLAALVVPAGLVVEAVEEEEGVVVGGVEVSMIMVGFMDVVVENEVEVKVISRLSLTALAVSVGVGLPLALAGEEAEPIGQSIPSKVTRAFSASQERFAELNRARMISDDKGTLKFALAPEIRRGMDSPRVTLLYTVPFELVILVRVHPLELATVHVDPVKPFAQMQEQALEEMMLVPPLAQGVVCWHWASWDAVVDEFEEDLLMTRRNRGTSTAAAMIRIVTKVMSRKSQIGSPQQRRPGFDPEGPFGFKALVEAIWVDQEACGRGLCSRGVAKPGGGKAASMPDRPDCGRLPSKATMCQ